MCGCGYGSYHGHVGWCGCGPVAWGPGFPFGRRFSTREEYIARLEEYVRTLQAEAKAVEERIAEMKAAG